MTPARLTSSRAQPAPTCRRRWSGVCVEWATVGDAGVMGELGCESVRAMATHLGVAHHARLTGDEAISVKASILNVTFLKLVEMEPTVGKKMVN